MLRLWSFSLIYFIYKIQNEIYVALHRRAWLKPNKMRILTALTPPAYPRNISCRGPGRGTDSAVNAETIQIEGPLLDAVGLEQRRLWLFSQPPSHLGVWNSLPALPYSTLPEWLHLDGHRNSSRVLSGLCACQSPSRKEGKQHLLSSAAQIMKD